MLAQLCLVPLPLFLLLAFGFSFVNKLSLLQLSLFASSIATLAYRALLLSGVFLPFRSPALHLSSYNCCHCAFNIESYSSLEYFFNSIFPLEVPWLVLVFCHQASLIWAREATLTLGAGPLLLIYWMRNVTTASKFFSFCRVLPSLWQLLCTTCHTWCNLTGIKLLILDQDLGTHIPLDFQG